MFTRSVKHYHSSQKRLVIDHKSPQKQTKPLREIPLAPLHLD